MYLNYIWLKSTSRKLNSCKLNSCKLKELRPNYRGLRRLRSSCPKLSLALGLLSIVMPGLASAGAMAVSLDDLYLYNNTSVSTTLQIENIAAKANQFVVPAHGICKINQPLLFQPFVAESNNFVIMLASAAWQNPIVIDQLGLLSLASDSVLQLPFKGKVKAYSLLGFCGNKLGQYKFLNVAAHDNAEHAPNFKLVNCNQTSNFVYFINDQYIQVKNRIKNLNFAKVSPCQLTSAD